LEKPEQFELLSLDPSRFEKRRPKEEFHCWRILGSMTVKDRESQNELVTALKKCVVESKRLVAGCFNPRHGIRVIQDGKTYDLVICFECLQVLVYLNENNLKPDNNFLIRDSSQSAESLLNRVLMKQKIPLAGR
jgi:hypothetical protein